MLSAHVQHIVFASHFSYCIYAQKAVPLQVFSLRGTFHPSRLFYPFRPFPSPVLFLPVVWQVFRLLSRLREFAGFPRNLDFWGAFSAEHIPPCVQTSRIPPLSIFTLYCLDLADFPASIFLPLHLKLYTLPLTLRADWTNR